MYAETTKYGVPFPKLVPKRLIQAHNGILSIEWFQLSPRGEAPFIPASTSTPTPARFSFLFTVLVKGYGSTTSATEVAPIHVLRQVRPRTNFLKRMRLGCNGLLSFVYVGRDHPHYTCKNPYSEPLPCILCASRPCKLILGIYSLLPVDLSICFSVTFTTLNIYIRDNRFRALVPFLVIYAIDRSFDPSPSSFY